MWCRQAAVHKLFVLSICVLSFHRTGRTLETLFLRPNFAGSNRMQVQVMSAAAELREQGNKLFEESHGEPWRAMESHGEGLAFDL